MSAATTAAASICVVLQTRNTFQWQDLPVMASVWPPGTMCRMFFSAETCAIASASAEFTLPSRKSTWSPSIILRDFWTAVPASPLVEVLDQQLRLLAEDAALAVDLVDGELAADGLVLAIGAVGARQRVAEAELDDVGRAGGDDIGAGDGGGAEGQGGFDKRTAVDRRRGRQKRHAVSSHVRTIVRAMPASP